MCAGRLLMFLVGGLGFYYATSRMQEVEPVPPDISISEYTRYPAGRWSCSAMAWPAWARSACCWPCFPRGADQGRALPDVVRRRR